MTNLERTSSTPSSLMVGRCAMSTVSSGSRGDRYMTPRVVGLLGVELDDQLLLHLSVDDLANGQRVHEYAQPARQYLKPRRRRLIARDRPGNDERIEFARLLDDLDDVVLGDPIARDVDPVTVNQEVAVAHELTRLVTTGRKPRAVDDVVETTLKDAQQVLASTARSTARLFVVAPELLFEDAVNARTLLLLAHLQQVLAVFGAAAAVLTR